ncbi:MAG: hypothetical protein D6717_13340 [Gammaproteobacteria bacterium]|nr:MAG: hypothetical protein D6717_13340 [Gammaproteobacteria bacterium]
MNSKLDQKVREALDAQASSLDEQTRARLRAARRQALTSGRGRWLPSARKSRLPAWGAAVAATLVLLLLAGLWGRQEAPELPLEDLEVLAETDDLDLYRELDFYLWLEREVSSGPQGQGHRS